MQTYVRVYLLGPGNNNLCMCNCVQPARHANVANLVKFNKLLAQLVQQSGFIAPHTLKTTVNRRVNATKSTRFLETVDISSLHLAQRK